MRRVLPIALGVALLAGCGERVLRGRLVDAMNADAPLSGEVMLARSVGTAPLTCQTLTGTTGEDGRFEIPGLCLQQTAYTLEAANDSLFLAEASPVDAAGGDLLLRAWWAPEEPGLYVLRGRDPVMLPTHTDLRTVRVGEETVAYPAGIPDVPPSIGAGEHLVISGPLDVGIAPLVPSGPRMFGEVPMAPWSYVGVRFVDDATIERVTAEPDPAKVREVAKDERKARYVAGDALPAGLYAVQLAGERRVSIVRFGAPPPP